MDRKTELLAGLMSTPKYIPGWYRYDKEGSRLNDLCLQENENYYFHRCEMNVCKKHMSAMLTSNEKNMVLVDMGSGNCQKARLFIDEILKKQSQLSFYPIDISCEFLVDVCRSLSEEYMGKLDLHPIGAEYEAGIREIKKCAHNKVILWFGSIQNLEHNDQIRKLRLIRSAMTENCCLLFSLDITQDKETILKAYNDAHGRKLYSNYITRLIREENSTIKPDDFHLEVNFIKEDSPTKISSVQALMRANRDTSFTVPTLGITVKLTGGEPLYLHEGSGLSYKYTLQQIQTLIQRAGLHLINTWIDDEEHVMFCKCKVV